MKSKNLFLLSWRKAWIIVVSGVIFIILHNLISGIFGIEEAFFFILVIFVLPAYVLIAIIYSLIYILKKKPKKKKRSRS
ncbi:MAG: hypothetical protein KKE23_01490 [Nanoarchaeota archaeon]|nr:hypothetical protein [Nanoarchaeota archaeon]